MFDTGGKDIYLIRHGETTWNYSHKIQGQRNPPLTLLGKKQAHAAAKYFSSLGHRDFRIISSDLKRAKDTAVYFSKMLHKRINYFSGIREISLGKWEGMTPEEVNFHFDNGFKRWLLKPSRIKIPGAESIRSFEKRIETSWKEMIPMFHPKNTIIITHGGVITALLARWLNTDFDHLILKLLINNGSITHIRQSGKRVLVVSINSTAHLGL